MTDDITTILQGVIQNDSGEASSYAQARADIHNSGADLLGNSANWMQLLSVVGPLYQENASKAVEEITANYEATKGLIQASGLPAGVQAGLLHDASEGYTEDTAAATQLSPGGVGGILLCVSIVLGLISSVGTGSAQSDQWGQLITELNNIAIDVVKIYWLGKLGSNGPLPDIWKPLGTDLDNIANEGTTGYNVTGYKGSMHDDANGFVNEFAMPPFWKDYWQAPSVEPAFEPPVAVWDPTVGDPTVFGPTGWLWFGWYGEWPSPEIAGVDWPVTDPKVTTDAGEVKDPTSALPFFTLGLTSYLSIESLRNIINSQDPYTLKVFADNFYKDLIRYTQILYNLYSAAAKGIVKAASPSPGDITAYFAGDRPPTRPLGPGDPWNGVYGVVATYPSYGVHAGWSGYPDWPGGVLYGGPIPTVSTWQSNTLEVSAPSYFISVLDNNPPPTRSWGFGDPDWDIPWVQNKVTLGAMARWKALYLINGYDRAWNLLGSLQDLVNQALQDQNLPGQVIVPDVMYLDDGTIADGNWSARELCNVLQLPTGPIYGGYDFTKTWGEEGKWLLSGYSMTRLLGFLQMTSGLQPADLASLPSGPPESPSPVISFRAVLAACDDESYGLPLALGG